MTAAQTKLATAFAGVRPPPCVVGPCPFYAQCASERMACSAFNRYLNSKAGAIHRRPGELPSRGLYKRLFPGRDEEEGA